MNRITPFLPLAMVFMPSAVASAQTVPPTPVPTISGARLDIVAEGEVIRTPDIAIIAAGVITQGRSAADAMSRNAERMAATVTALKQAGVAERDIQTSSINLSPQYRYGQNVPPVITGYQASNQVNVRFRDIKRTGAVLDALVAVGANQISGPSFGIDKPDVALDEARTAAMAKARARAELYARAAGLSIKRILSISESGSVTPPYPPPMVQAMRVEKAADTPIEAGEQRLAVSVSVSFELQ